MKKRLLAIIATVAMVVAMMPSMVFGATTVTTAADLKTEAAKGGEIVLGGDITVTETITIGVFAGSTKTVTLDLNGRTLTLNGSNAYLYVQNTGTLIIKDSVGGGKITNAGASSSANQLVYVKGNCEINGGTIENTISGKAALYVHNGDNKKATCVLNNGVIVHTYDGSGNAVKVGSNATFTMNGGTVKSLANKANPPKGIPAIDGGAATSKVIINDGKIDAAGTGIQSSGAPVEITGGTIEAGGYALSTRYSNITPADGKEVNISAGIAILKPYSAPADGSDGNVIDGGNFDAPELSYGDNAANAVVSGGTFKDGNNAMDGVEDYLADGGYVQDPTTGEVSKPAPAPTPTPEPSKPEASPNTGDNSVAPFAVAGLVLAAMAAVVVTRKRFN